MVQRMLAERRQTRTDGLNSHRSSPRYTDQKVTLNKVDSSAGRETDGRTENSHEPLHHHMLLEHSQLNSQLQSISQGHQSNSSWHRYQQAMLFAQQELQK